MIDVKDRYFSLNRTLLLALGLWPYQTSKLARFHLGFFYIILITSIIFQLTPLLTSKFSIDLLIKLCSNVSNFICLTIKYNSFYFNKDTVKYLIEELQHICDKLKDNEITIIDKYGSIGKRYTIGLTMLVVIGACVILISQLCSNLINNNLSVNISYKHHQSQFIITEYFIDQETYSSFILLHICSTLWIGIFALVATGTTLIACLHHACGLFKVASFRIKHIINIRKHQDILINKYLISKNITCAVDIHRKAMVYANSLISNFETSFFFLIVFGVLTLTLSVYRIFQVLSSTCKDPSLPFCVVSASFAVTYMFFANFMGQQIIDHNNDVYAAAYEIPWYLTSQPIQRQVLIVLQRGNKIFGLNVGGLFIASLQCFATLINASISYFTVIYSAK